MHGVGKTKHVEPNPRRGGPSPRAGDRHDDVAVDNPTHRALYIRHFHRVLERQDSQEETHFDPADLWRTRPGPGPIGMRLLLLRTTDGSRRSGRIAAFVADGRLDDHVYGRVHVHLRRNHG